MIYKVTNRITTHLTTLLIKVTASRGVSGKLLCLMGGRRLTYT